MKTYKVEFKLYGDWFTTSTVRFATPEEAEACVRQLLAPEDFQLFETDDPVTHVWRDHGGLYPAEEAK